MKKIFYLFAAAAVLAACTEKDPAENKDPEVPTEPTSLQITATNPFGWAKADKVSILDGEKNNLFRSQGAGQSAVLAGEALPVKLLYGFAPYDEKASLSGSSILASIPTTQVLTADKTPAVIAGKSEDGANMEFKAVAGFVEISFAEDAQNITALSLASANGEAITGPVEVKLEDGAAVVSAKSETATVSVTAFEETFKAGSSYFVAVLPGTYQGGFTVNYTFRGVLNSIDVAGPVTVTAGESTKLATINRPLSAVEKLLIGEWELSKYGSGSWLSTNLPEGKQVPEACKGDYIKFNMDGTVTIDLGEDGVTYNVTEESTPSPELTGEETWTLAEDETVLKLSGNAFPLILGNSNGLTTDYKITSVTAAELVLEYLYTDSEGTPDVPFKIFLQPKGMKRVFHSFAQGDFGLQYDEENVGYVPEGGLQPLTIGGISFTMEPVTAGGAECTFGWFTWGAMRVGAWGGDSSIKSLTIKIAGVTGNVKSVSVDVWNQEEYNDCAEYVVTVGGQPFGNKGFLKGTSTPCTATSTEPASGEIVFKAEKTNNDVDLAFLLRSIEVVYQE